MIQALLQHLIYTPSINIPLGLSDIETFPWALLFCLSPKLVIDRAYIYLMLLFGLSALASLYVFGSPVDVIRSYFAILNASLIFYRLLGADQNEFHQLIKAMVVIFFLNAFMSFIQMAGLFPDFLEPIYRQFVKRFTHEGLDGGRGVGGLYAEPAYSSYAMHFMFVFMALWWRLDPFTRRGAIAFTAMLLFDVFINRSATGTLFLVVIFVSFVQRRTLLQLSLSIGGGLLGILLLVPFMEEPPRALDLLHNIFFTWDTDDVYMTLMNESGHRLFSIMSAYKYGILHPLGAGMGSWPVSSVWAMEDMGINSFEIYYFLEFNEGFFKGIRPTAFAAGLFLEVGVVGTLAFIAVLFRHWIALPYLTNSYWRAIVNVFLFNFFLIGTIGDPMPYIALAMGVLAVTKFLPPPMGSVEAPPISPTSDTPLQ
jgi:hypothetical protein